MKYQIYFFLLLAALLRCSPLQASDYDYVLRWLTPNTHTYVIELTVNASASGYTDFQMATWRPGRYILQDYAAAVSHFEAVRPEGGPLRWEKTTPSTWRVYADGGKVRIRYRYYANNKDAGSSYYGDGQVYFNPINCFMYVPGRLDREVKLWVPELPVDWKVATALYPGEVPGEFLAETWHEFADSPTVFAERVKQLSFEAEGVRFYLHFQGEYMGDEAVDQAILETTEKICREQGAIFGGFPFREYHFIYRLLRQEIYHAVEHSRSSSYALPAHVTQEAEKITGGILNMITSHEFFHAWNVKRIRPAALFPYDYSQPQYTHLHWFTEGVTDYYTHLALVRAGIQTPDYLWQQMGLTINSMQNGYAAEVVSPAASSFNSWLSGSDYEHPDHRISYYSQGRYMGFLMDLKVRGDTDGRVSLDDVFRYLYKEYYQRGQGVPEDGIQKVLEELSGQSWQRFFDRYVFGTASPDFEIIFKPLGLELKEEENKDSGARRLGINSLQEQSEGLLVRRLRPGTDAWQAGLAEGDIITRLNGEKSSQEALNAAANKLKKGRSLSLTVKRGDLPAREMEVQFAETFVPTNYTLVERKRLRDEQQALLEAYLRSVQEK